MPSLLPSETVSGHSPTPPAVPHTRRDWRRNLVWDHDLPAEILDLLGSRPDDLIAAGEPLKLGRGTTVVKVSGPRPAVVKRYNLRTWTRTLVHLFLPSRARRSWEGAKALLEAGIPTPRPLAYLESTWGPLRLRSFYVYEFLEGITLDQYLEAAGPPDTERVLLEQLRAISDRFRAARLTHGDGKNQNFLVTDRGLTVIDTDNVRRHASESAWRQARDREIDRLLQDYRARPEWEAALADAVDADRPAGGNPPVAPDDRPKKTLGRPNSLKRAAKVCR